MKTSLTSKRSYHLNAATFTAATLISLSSFVAQAADIFWTGGTASYTNAANWTGGIVPGASDNAINTNGLGNVVQINAGNPDWTVIDLQAGSIEGTSGAFEQNGQAVSSTGWTRLGLATNSSGSYTLNAGTLNVLGGRIILAEGENSAATLTLNGGVLNKTGDAFDIGEAGIGTLHSSTGTVNQVGGTVNCSSEIWVGQGGDGIGIASGVYNLSGGTINVSNWVALGRSGGNGKMSVTGGVINKYGGGSFLVGTGFSTPAGGSSVGQLDHSAGTINIQNGELLIPENAPSTGTYNISGAASLVVNSWIAVGRGGAAGVLNLSGGSITKTGGGNIVIGAGGGSVGTLTQTGGTLTNATSQVWVGENGTGTWDLNGGSAYLGVIHIAQTASSIGTMNLNGGFCNAFEITTGDLTGFSTLTLNGGTIQANGDNTAFIHDLITAQISSGGVTFDSQGFNIGIPQTFTDAGGGGLTKIGSGTLTLTAANSYTGPTVVNGGKLAVTTAASGGGSYAVGNGADLGVTVLSGNAQLNASSLTLATSTSALLDLDLGSFGNPSSAPVNVSGAMAVNGTITVNITDGLPQLGQFPLIKYGSRTGSGSFVLGSLPTGIVAAIVTNTPNSSIDLNITTVNTPRWDGQAGGNWDIGLTTNWVNAGTGLPTTFNNGNPATFDDNALGTTTVNLVTTVNPAQVTANNSNLNYTLVGSGKITGPGVFTKNGGGVFTIANTGGNNYTGATVVANGTLSVTNLANGGSPSAIGASSANPTNLVFAGGTLSYAGPAMAINRGYSASVGGGIETLSDLTLSGTPIMGGGGELRKTGPAKLTYTGTGSNALSGYLIAGSTYRVVNGTVLLDGSAGPQTNYARSLRLGLADATNTLNSTLILTNTTLDVRNGFSIGDHNNATGTLIIENSTLFHRGNGNAFDLGDNNNGLPCTGVVTQNNSTLHLNGELWVGQTTNGIGIYTLNSGTINLSNWLAIGRSSGNGTFNMTGGTLNKYANGNFIIGTGAGNNARTSVGTLNHSGGTINCANEYWVAENGLDIGTNNISGTAVVNWNNWVSIGRRGTGVVNFASGTINRSGGGVAIVIGDRLDTAFPGNGYVNQSGGTLTSANELWIGQGTGTAGPSVGRYDLSGTGTVTVNNWVAIGRGGGIGTLNISGGSLTKTGNANNRLLVGADSPGPGTINQTGGTITSVLSSTMIGNGGTGLWNLNGGSAILSIVHISENSGVSGTLNLNGGTLSATEVTTGNVGGNSTLNFNGGTLLAANGANLNFLHDLTTANVLAGGAIIDSGTNLINASQALLDGGAGGGLTKNGIGTLRLNGVNTYTGTTTVSAGTLGGTGTIAGSVTFAGSATVAPGASVGTLTVNNSVTLGGGAVMEVSRDGGVPSSDLLTVSGNLAYSGTLTVVLTGTNALAFNDTFNLFDWGTRSGSFTTINLPAGYSFDTSQLNVDGTIRVTAVPATITSSTVSGGNLILQGVGGPPGASYSWLTSPNVTAPMSTWTTNSTGVFDGSGGFSNAFPINASIPARFFRLKTP
jgi:autotransporter-associated beta strand protein